MKYALHVCMLSFALLFGGANARATEPKATSVSQTRCQKNAALSGCKKGNAPKAKKKTLTKKIPERVTPLVNESAAPEEATPPLSVKQSAMREAFMECMKLSTPASPTNDVVEFVFRTQATRENASLRSFLQAWRGSPVHHGHEVCLVRAFGLKGFRDLLDIKEDAGTRLVDVASPHVDVVKSEVPPDRRFAREWVRDYVHVLGWDMHQHFLKHGSGESPPSLRITSMIRSHEDQATLVRRGKSPADCRYDFLCSSHTSASGIDLGLKHVGRAERVWLEQRLIFDQRARKIFFIRENSHYHVFVIPPKYMGEE